MFELRDRPQHQRVWHGVTLRVRRVCSAQSMGIFDTLNIIPQTSIELELAEHD